MFANLLPWFSRDPDSPHVEATGYDHAFVEEVTAHRPTPPSPQVERFILICWLLIAVKHLAVIWAVYHFHMPFNQLIVNFPTWLLGLVATLVYYRRVE